ncbi:helix-turn-helix transcriptional regulator [Candidatus Enterococcus ikei]|uniref:Helix-turn-helix transcriptional regulator n=1 Tax=Candidatus Enterococcus ikei TaxID=2815326 RepID=A0ABS3H3D1_9ENTE|nr:helix-turn-helix transcriptional regulator [Enterococcus sp. DIV0869a]MBO0441501.1 helix-turn-helix transcriptional regulator [Enterococcus sp. DIV0869a]
MKRELAPKPKREKEAPYLFKNRIREIRESKGMLRTELSSKVNVSYQTMFRLEREEFSPSLLLAHDIADVLGRSIDQVFIFEKKEE